MAMIPISSQREFNGFAIQTDKHGCRQVNALGKRQAEGEV
jgi:hypothetical protein